MKKALWVLVLVFNSLVASAQVSFPPIPRVDVDQLKTKTPWLPVQGLALDNSSITSFRYHPDGQHLIVSTDSGEVMLVNIPGGDPVWRAPLPGEPQILDVDPQGQTFLTASQGKLNLHSLKNGKILKNLTEESTFFDSSAAVDHRKPTQSVINERRDMGWGNNWILVPNWASYSSDGKTILILWVNDMTGPNLYDRRMQLHDKGTLKRIWEHQLRSDNENYDDAQPAGFTVSLPFPPAFWDGISKTLYFGTPHARVHAAGEALILANQKIPDVFKKKSPPVWAIPRHKKASYSDMAMPISSLALSADRSKLFVSAGEAGEDQIFAYSFPAGKLLKSSGEFDVTDIKASPKGSLIMSGYLSGGVSRFNIIDTASGELLYRGPRFGSLDTNTGQFNPVFKEVAVKSGGAVFFLQPRTVKSVTLTGKWQKTGIYVKIGTSIQGWGSGGIEVSTLDTPEDERWSRSETDDFNIGEADGRIDLVGDASLEGELWLKSDKKGVWTLYGGLSAQEFGDPDRLRRGESWR